MKLVSLELKNFLKHSHYLLQYETGLTGVVGANGQGKSTVASTALLFALTGILPEGRTKSSMLTWNKNSGSTKLVFIDNANQTWELTRNLHNAGVCLETPGKQYTKQADVQKMMEDMLGVSKELLAYLSFAQQCQLIDIVDANHSVRVEQFQRLADVFYIEGLRASLQESIGNIPVYPDMTVLKSNTEKQIKEHNDKISSLTSSISTLSTQFYERSAKLPKYELIAQALPDSQFNDEVNRRNDLILVSQYDLDIVLASLVKLGSADNVDLADDYKQFNKYEQKQTLESRLAKLVTPVSPAVVQEPDISVIDTYRQFKESNKAKYELTKSGKCPTCNRVYTDSELLSSDDVSLYEEVIKTLPVMEVAYNKDMTSYREYLTKLEIYKTQKANYDRDSTELTKDIASLDLELTGFDLSTFRLKQQEAERSSKNKAEIDKINKEKERLQLDIASKRAALAEYENQAHYSDSLIATAKQFIADTNTMSNTIVKMQSEKTLLEQNLLQLNEVLHTCAVNEQKKIKAEKNRELFTKARDVLHRDRLPTVVMQKLLGRLNSGIALHLSAFEVDFTARLNDSMDFIVDFYSKGVSNCSAKDTLSVGQKVALAISFRLALLSMMPCSLPLLVLDEPSAYLDEDNMRAMSDVLQKVRTKAEKGMYILLITHEKALTTSLTRTIYV